MQLPTLPEAKTEKDMEELISWHAACMVAMCGKFLARGNGGKSSMYESIGMANTAINAAGEVLSERMDKMGDTDEKAA